MGFSRQEHWSGLPFPSPGGHLIQGSNLNYRQILYRLRPKEALADRGSPNTSSWPLNCEQRHHHVILLPEYSIWWTEKSQCAPKRSSPPAGRCPLGLPPSLLTVEAGLFPPRRLSFSCSSNLYFKPRALNTSWWTWWGKQGAGYNWGFLRKKNHYLLFLLTSHFEP